MSAVATIMYLEVVERKAYAGQWHRYRAAYHSRDGSHPLDGNSRLQDAGQKRKGYFGIEVTQKCQARNYVSNSVT